MRLRLIFLFAALTTNLTAQPVGSQPTFGSDEIAIYRDFLLHYPEQLSNVIGMQDTTVQFESPLGSRQPAILQGLIVPAYQLRRLPPEIMALTTEQAVTARIAAKGKLIPPSKRGPQQGPDGYVRTHLTLSDIAFDPQHKRAAFVFSASCNCLGGQGGVVVYERKNGHWKQMSVLDSWEG